MAEQPLQEANGQFVECDRCGRAVAVDDLNENGWCDRCAEWFDEEDDDDA